MRVYKTDHGIEVESAGHYYDLGSLDWDKFINDEDLFGKVTRVIETAAPATKLRGQALAPIGAGQELWACGVTYLRSKVGRQEESKASGGSDFYARVYDAERPEVFFKSTPHRVVGDGALVNIRKDSTWDVPEPELTLLASSGGKIIGYTIGNDMSSRSIEGENPLYLPQAKTYDGCAALGPCIYVADKRLDNAMINMEIMRNNQSVFNGAVGIDQMKRRPEELVQFVFRECSFPNGCLIMTGTGIVPGNDFTLRSGDEIRIQIEPIGTLVNTVR